MDLPGGFGRYLRPCSGAPTSSSVGAARHKLGDLVAEFYSSHSWDSGATLVGTPVAGGGSRDSLERTPR
jgi:hypothetical protein